jgi:imidazolonepropionase
LSVPERFRLLMPGDQKIRDARVVWRLEGQVGSLEPGKLADVLVLAAPDYRHLGYRYGVNLVQTVIKAGVVVVENPPV